LDLLSQKGGMNNTLAVLYIDLDDFRMIGFGKKKNLRKC
jgi:GGDEF domain-containing protein